MRLPTPTRSLPLPEFVALMATLMGLVALSVDAMLPAFDAMARDLGVTQPQRMQYVVLALFAGLSLGQLVFGPASDRFGRRPMILAGMALFGLGSLVAAGASGLAELLVGRVLQGLGAAAPRVIASAMVRDLYHGRTLARVNSLVTGIFIVVPMLAPALGLAVLKLWGWRAIFGMLMLFACAGAAWLILRQPETLAPSRRRSMHPRRLWDAAREVLSHPRSRPYVLATGLTFAPFFAYLGNAQTIFVGFYGQGDLFVFWFGLLALTIGLASLINARLVMRWGARRVVRVALGTLVADCTLYALARLLWPAIDGLAPTLLWLGLAFFCIGLLFGNLLALSLEPLGHIAGVASALANTVSTVVAMVVGGFIGHHVVHGVDPLVLGILACGLVALALVWRDSHLPETPHEPPAAALQGPPEPA